MLSYSTMIVTDDDSIDDVKPHLTYRLVDSQPKVRELLGISDSDIDRIRSAMADGLVAAGRFIEDEWVLPFVIHGSRAECATQLGALMTEHGFDEYLLPVLDPRTAVEVMTRVAGVVAGAAPH